MLAGDLHDFDVGPAAYPTAYASFPATLFVSPGTALRASVLWVTPVQLTALTWTEVSYRLGRLAPIRFEPDLPAPPRRSRSWRSPRAGARSASTARSPRSPRSRPADRTVPEFTQEDLLERLAGARSATAPRRATS